jgi:hypothetical protein
MAADTSAKNVVPEKGGGFRLHAADNHVTKLYPICKLSAGIAFYGIGLIGDKRTDQWTAEFIRRNESNYGSLDSFGRALSDELNNIFSPAQAPELLVFHTGFHLAGYEELANGSGPALYHIDHGTKRWGYTKRYPMWDSKPLSSRPLFTGGDSDLCKKVRELRDGNVGPKSLTEPCLDNDYLRIRCDYLRFLISHTYRMTNQDQWIDAPVTTLSISVDGIQKYEERADVQRRET